MKLSQVVKWPYWMLRKPWPDHVSQFQYLDKETQKRLVYQQIDKGGFGYWTVFVAGIGFLTDAYDIFAVNTILPMLGLVYWNGSIPRQDSVLISLSLLVGTFFGQLLLGVLGDRYGRRRIYGVELMVLTIATILMAIASKGALKGSNKVAWLASWRFIMGIGIGGDYPLSAVIVAEFAPRRHRGRMLSSLFFMQALGALTANIVTVTVVHIFQDGLPRDRVCEKACIETVDLVWRWIVGLGAIPPACAIFMRWWIPESPRYSIEIENDHDRATRDVQGYFGANKGTLLNHENHDPEAQPVENVPKSASQRSSNQAPITFGEPTETDDIELKGATFTESINSTPKLPAFVSKETWKEWYLGLHHYLITEENWTDLAGTSLSWLVLDFAFYCLSVNNPKVLNKLWNTEGVHSIYSTLMESGYRAMIAVSLGSIIGGALFICLARYRWALQVYGFWMLAGVFIIVGICFVTLLGTRYFAAVIVLYSICSIFFNFGPNTSTYVLAAEVFPTKYRSTCHGISAAAGKLGAIFAQLFLQYARINGVGVNDPRSTWLGWVLLIFSVWMAVGAVITRFWVPNPVDTWGRSRSLEEMGQGKKYRKMIEKEEMEVWQSLAPGSPVIRRR